MMMNATRIKKVSSRTHCYAYFTVSNRITILFVEIGIGVRDTIRFMKRDTKVPEKGATLCRLRIESFTRFLKFDM